jgi:predicted ATP-grasp superfamily ATP-dependent carboligase
LHSTDKLNTPRYPIPDSRSFETLNDKWQFYRLCSKLGVKAPKTIWLGNKAEIDFELVCATVGLPFVLKPTNRSDGLGVQIVRSKDDLQRKVLSQSNYDFSPLIAQTFIPGLDIDMSALVDRGRIKHFAIQTRKKDALWFVKSGDFVRLTETVVSELSYTGLIHIDARLNHRSGEIFLVEANPRFWGSLADATAGGLNFVRAGIYASAGLEGPDPTTLSEVSVPSVGKMLAEIATFRRSYFKMARIDRLRLRRGIRSNIRRLLSLPTRWKARGTHDYMRRREL